MTGSEWWRTAVIYQIYPRSFADSNGDGIGDLPGITSRLESLKDLGVDALWLSPFYTSPQKDAGYDVANYCDVDPLFGTLKDFDLLEAKAHSLGLKLIVDIVPNHSSDQHPWFTAALAAGEGSVERQHYIFRDGKGSAGELPPNNWESVFGGPAWTRVTKPDGTPGQWYLHLFDTSQPDFHWQDPWVRERFREILRFWLDRGVDGFRVDVAHGVTKEDGLPDEVVPKDKLYQPYWAHDGVHEIYRDWRIVLEGYAGDRVLCAEAWVEPVSKLARWVRFDEMHQAFNFSYLETPWSAPELRAKIDESITAFGAVGAPSTWVLSNHDVVRHPTRLALTYENPQGAGLGPNSGPAPDPVLGLRRARAATSLMLSLPGSAYLYQGEELGLPEVIDLPDAARQDPTWSRTNGERYGRDGCRVPLPWEAKAPSFGFGPTSKSWLPQPADWAALARDTQSGTPGSTLELYRTALALRREHGLGLGAIDWLTEKSKRVLAFRNGAVTVYANTGTTTSPLPNGEVILASGPLENGKLPGDTTVWMLVS
jgi:alpha-glucosidase